MNEGKINSTPYDEIYTPAYAVKVLLPYLKPNSKILCPFDMAHSEYVKVLSNAGHIVYYSHLELGGGKDFLTYTKQEVDMFDYIISNPPFSVKDSVLTKLYELNKPFAMLLPISTLEGVYRSTLFQKHGLEVLVLDKRINFQGQKKGNWQNTSYFCSSILPKQLIFHTLDKEGEG
jgi:hypothetical protein